MRVAAADAPQPPSTTHRTHSTHTHQSRAAAAPRRTFGDGPVPSRSRPSLELLQGAGVDDRDTPPAAGDPPRAPARQPTAARARRAGCQRASGARWAPPVSGVAQRNRSWPRRRGRQRHGGHASAAAGQAGWATTRRCQCAAQPAPPLACGCRLASRNVPLASAPNIISCAGLSARVPLMSASLPACPAQLSRCSTLCTRQRRRRQQRQGGGHFCAITARDCPRHQVPPALAAAQPATVPRPPWQPTGSRQEWKIPITPGAGARSVRCSRSGLQALPGPSGAAQPLWAGLIFLEVPKRRLCCAGIAGDTCGSRYSASVTAAQRSGFNGPAAQAK